MKKLRKLISAQVIVILLMASGLGFLGSQMNLNLGLDLKGGVQLDYQIDLSSIAEEDKASIIEGVQEVIRKRVDSLGVAEPNIYTSNTANDYHIIVELAGIDDIEEARTIVGKTIQLEFKEENSTPNTDQEKIAEENAKSFYQAIQSGTDFETLAKAEQKELENDVVYASTDLVELDFYSAEIQSAIKDKAVDSILAPFLTDESYILDTENNVRESNGFVVIQIKERATEEVEEKIEGTVSARHILINSSKTNEDATRTHAEAKTLAEDLLNRVKNGEILAELAQEFSDDLGSAQNGGDLGAFKKGVMVKEFEETAFALEVGQTSEIIESDFGFHIIEVYGKTPESTETKTVEQFALNKITFNSIPNPWAEEAVLTGEHFVRADVALNEAYQPYVSISFNAEGASLFEELTEKNIGKSIAIFVGGQLISAPTVNQAISGGEAQITGSFTLQEAQNLARDLNTGALPAPIELVGQYTISASLGAEALDQSIYAALIGFVALGLYMILYYRLPGVFANVALVIYSIILLFLIKSALSVWVALAISLGVFVYLVHLLIKNKDSAGEKFISFLLACTVLFFLSFVIANPITLTLAGIAGVILSIGMAVDANILIFERMKEELRAGEKLEDAIENGFNRAWDSIRDSNFSSLITCAILFYFGSSIIRGFALNLALGILISMFSAIMLTRTFLRWSAKSKLASNKALFANMKAKAPKFDFIAKSKVWAILSGVLVTVSLLATVIFGLKLSLDFTGGAMLEVKFIEEESQETKLFTVEDIQNSLADIQLEEPLTSLNVVVTDQDSVLIRTRDLNEADHSAIIAELEKDLSTLEEIRFTSVGPSIGETLKQRALIALAITLAMIVIYVAFAFRKMSKEVSSWKFGLSTIFALVHDIVIVIGIFAILGKLFGVEIDALFITALLTILGFSVHDTIVVMDRVRENIKYRKSTDTFADSINKALNQTLSRSVNTSISTLLTIIALLIWGAESTFWFVLTLAIGIVVGTYSSIFVASPLLAWWNQKSKKSSKE